MLTMQQFDELDTESIIVGPPLFPTIDKELCVELACIIKEPEKAVFNVTFKGVRIGDWACDKKNDELLWRKL